MVMVMMICEAVDVLLGGFMLGCVMKEEGEEQNEPGRRHATVLLAYVLT